MIKNVVKNIVGGVVLITFLVYAYVYWDAYTRANYACRYAAKGESAEKAIAQLRAVAAAAGAKVTEGEGRVTADFEFAWEKVSCAITHKDGRVLEGSRRSF